MAREVLIDPIWLRYNDGEFVENSKTYDSYFEPEDTTAPLGHLVDGLVEQLPRRQRRCIELRVFARMPYSEIAERMDFYCGDPPYPNKKKAWRAVHRALDTLEDQLRKIDPRLADKIGLILPEEEDE